MEGVHGEADEWLSQTESRAP